MPSVYIPDAANVPPPDDWPNAACRDNPSTFDLTFEPPNGKPREAWEAFAEDVRFARQICAACPVRELCLAYAVETRQQWGMWGGTMPDERGARRVQAASPHSLNVCARGHVGEYRYNNPSKTKRTCKACERERRAARRLMQSASHVEVAS